MIFTNFSLKTFLFFFKLFHNEQPVFEAPLVEASVTPATDRQGGRFLLLLVVWTWRCRGCWRLYQWKGARELHCGLHSWALCPINCISWWARVLVIDYKHVKSARKNGMASQVLLHA